MNGMLIIRNGAPFYEGASVPIPKDKACIIGRSSEEWEPYLAFQSAYISRKHFEVTYESNAFFITDLFSKHGTKVNGEELKKSIWPERVESNGEILVAAEELNALIYRVRKKIGTYLEIEVIRGKGYWLHFNENGRE